VLLPLPFLAVSGGIRADRSARMAGDKARDKHPGDGDRGAEALWAKIDDHGASIQAQGELLKDVARKLDELTGRLDAMDVNNNRSQQDDGEGARDYARGRPFVEQVPAGQRRIENPLWDSDDDEDPYAEYHNRGDLGHGDRFNHGFGGNRGGRFN